MIKMISPIGVRIRTSEDRVEALKESGYRVVEQAPVEIAPEKKTRTRSRKATEVGE